jgi:hypothetical protein
MIKNIYYIFLFFSYLIKENLKKFRDLVVILTRFRVIHYIIFLVNRDTNPFRDKLFRKFIISNKKKWIKNKVNNIDKSKDNILVSSWIYSHPAGAVGESMIGKYVSDYYNYNQIGFILKGDIGSEVVLRSYGINKIIYLDKNNLFLRFKFFIEAIKIINKIKSIDEFLNLEINGINFGKPVYEHIVRHTGVAAIEKFSFKFYYFLSEALFIESFCKKITKKYKIKGLVQSETQFIPCNITYQFFIINRTKVYSRYGAGKKISMRVFSEKKEIFNFRSEPSESIFNEILNNHKKIAIESGSKLLKERFQGNLKDDYSGSRDLAHENKKVYSKDEICELYNWDKKKKIVCIFGHAFIDGNFLSGWRIFRDNLTWLRKTLNFITKNEKYNWLIKPHPAEIEYVHSKTNTINEFNSIASKFNHIKLAPNDISHRSLNDFVDYVVTNNGSVGWEYTIYGKKSLLAARSDYSDFLFKEQIPKNESEYFKKLENFENVEQVSEEQIEKAKIFSFLVSDLCYVENLLYPARYDVSLFVDIDKFWNEASELVDNYLSENDYFKEMINHQLRNNLRHTMDLNTLKK